MTSNLLSRYGDLVAGIASLLGAVLAAAFCLELRGFTILVKEGSAAAVWLIFSASHAVYHFARPKGTGYRQGPYIHPLFNAFLDIAFIFPYVGLALSLFGGSLLLQNPAWISASEFFLNFLNGIVVFFLAASFFAGINSIEDHFSAQARRHHHGHN